MIDYLAKLLVGGVLKFFAGVAIALLLLTHGAQEPTQIEDPPEPSEQTAIER